METFSRPFLTPSSRAVLARWLGLWALMMQVMVPLGQAVPLAAEGQGQLPRSLVVCSALGSLRLVDIPGSKSPDSSSRGPASHGQSSAACAVCLALAAGGHLLLPSLPVLPLPAESALAAAFPSALAALAEPAPGLPLPRGPPVVA